MKQAKIKVRKEIQRGVKGYVYLGCENVAMYGELPHSYLAGSEPWFYAYSDKSQQIAMAGYVLVPNKFYVNSLWEEQILPVLKEAGNRLHEIMKGIKETEKTWNGEETILI
jgi:hypothetical protein